MAVVYHFNIIMGLRMTIDQMVKQERRLQIDNKRNACVRGMQYGARACDYCNDVNDRR